MPLGDMLFDPQTSGGVLAVVPSTKAAKLCNILKRDIAPASNVVGTIIFQETGIFIN